MLSPTDIEPNLRKLSTSVWWLTFLIKIGCARFQGCPQHPIPQTKKIFLKIGIGGKVHLNAKENFATRD